LSTLRRNQVSEVTQAGRIFIRDGTLLPRTLQIESEPYTSGWRSVKRLDGYGLGRKIHDAGWTFFYLAYETKAGVFGIDGEKMVRRAMERILANRKLEKFNSLEVVRVASKHFSGIHHVTVTARSRHIQESPILFRPNDKNSEVALNGLDWPEDQNAALSAGKGLPLDEIKMPNLETVDV
jgi:hypothetical protein